jgi:hypothetical protein
MRGADARDPDDDTDPETYPHSSCAVHGVYVGCGHFLYSSTQSVHQTHFTIKLKCKNQYISDGLLRGGK